MFRLNCLFKISLILSLATLKTEIKIIRYFTYLNFFMRTEIAYKIIDSLCAGEKTFISKWLYRRFLKHFNFDFKGLA